MAAYPLIVEIKGNSLDDGPGIRSVIFFKGCPLSCSWCHNPECQSARRELMFDPEKCIGCGSCIERCPRQALSRENVFFVDREACELCFSCCAVCPAAALAPVGRRMEPGEIAARVLKDKPFFDNSGGGVTLSGGEPTMQMAFMVELLEALKEKGVHTLIETCGLFELAEFRRLALPLIDIIYMDLKLIDSGLHKRFCGADNAVILENMVRLHELSRSGKFSIIPRLPLVPGITATAANLAAAAQFLRRHGFKESRLLPYNPLWGEKLYRIGLPNPYAKEHPMMHWLPKEVLERSTQLWKEYGL
ncbi:MAG: glycyl-radical enzyme activating protein [Bacillota bacterium]